VIEESPISLSNGAGGLFSSTHSFRICLAVEGAKSECATKECRNLSGNAAGFLMRNELAIVCTEQHYHTGLLRLDRLTLSLLEIPSQIRVAPKAFRKR
jgi:hypothetical protein